MGPKWRGRRESTPLSSCLCADREPTPCPRKKHFSDLSGPSEFLSPEWIPKILTGKCHPSSSVDCVQEAQKTTHSDIHKRNIGRSRNLLLMFFLQRFLREIRAKKFGQFRIQLQELTQNPHQRTFVFLTKSERARSVDVYPYIECPI